MVEVNTAAIDTPKFEGRPQISAVSRAKALAGNPQLSSESQQAIQQGAQPPFVNNKSDNEPFSNDNEDSSPAVSEDAVDAKIAEISTALSSGTVDVGGGDVGANIDIAV